MYKGIIILIIANLCFYISFGRVNEFQKDKLIENVMMTAQYSLYRDSVELRKTTEIESFDASSDTISIKKIVTEVIINYQTEEKNWVYDNNSWIYRNMKVNAQPPSYEKQTISKRHISEFNKEKNTYTSSIEKEEIIEYYKIADGWTWNDNLMKWVFENGAINTSPKYKLLKTVSFKLMNRYEKQSETRCIYPVK